MNQGRHRRTAQPRVTKAPPVWQREPDVFADYRTENLTEQSQETTEAYAAPPEPAPQPRREANGSNMAVRLTCTVCSMLGLFGLFMCWAEKENRAIRHFAVQSAALTVIHAAAGVCLALIQTALGGIPYFGFVVSLLGWLGYAAMLAALVLVRVRMMQSAWQGRLFHVPVVYRMVRRRIQVK